MTALVALLRAVNVGGRKLIMTDLKALAEDLGLTDPRTYIASRNLIFASDLPEPQVKARLEKRLAEHMGASVPVMIRTAPELDRALKANPFASVAGNRVAVIFLDEPPAANSIETVVNVVDERIALGKREVYVAYGEQGMGQSRLRIPAASSGTARNLNTVAKLAELARETR